MTHLDGNSAMFRNFLNALFLLKRRHREPWYYGSPISRDLARFNSSLRDWISRDFGCEICEIKKGSKVPILVDKFSIFNQKLQLKIEIYLLWFFISPNLTYMQDYNVYKIFKMFSTFKSVQFFNFLCLRFNLARFY